MTLFVWTSNGTVYWIPYYNKIYSTLKENITDDVYLVLSYHMKNIKCWSDYTSDYTRRVMKTFQI